LYDKAIAIIPEFPEAQYQRGVAFIALRRLDDAESAFRLALKAREDWTLALASLGSVLVEKRQYPEAEKVLNRAVELDDLNFPAYAALADLRLKTGAPPESLAALLKTVTGLTGKASPTASIWSSRAALETALGDRKAANVSIANALQLEPKNLSALSQAAELALADNDPTRAEEFVRRLEAISPSGEGIKILRAKTLLAKGNADEAVAMLAAIENPSEETSKLKTSIELNFSTDTAAIEKQLAADPKNAAALGRLCSLLRVKDPMRALDYCRRASEAEPENIDHAIGYGAALVQAKDYERAVSLFRRLLQFAPDNSTAHANLATALFQLKRYAEAKAEYKWLVDRQPGLSVAYYFLAITHDQLEEYADAMANYQQFLRVADPAANKLEIEKVQLRLPILQRQIKSGKGKRNG
jgi:tetratricopeptide (TPR) repeat protein